MSENQNDAEQIFDEEENSDEWNEEFEDVDYWYDNFCEEEFEFDDEISGEEEEEEEEGTEEVKNPCINDSFASILTRVTPASSFVSDYDGICLNLYSESNSAIIANESYDFKPNEKGDTEIFYDIVENDDRNSIDRYAEECFKYGIPRIGAVIECLQGDPVLNLKHYGMGTIGLQFALDVFCGPPVTNITHIDLTNSPFSETACYPLSEFMIQSYTLEYLNLSNCNIGEKGAEILAEGIEMSFSIKTLNLSKCNLQDNGGGIVADALASNEICKAVDLSDNFLGTISGVKLGSMLVKNGALELLELSWNLLFPQKEACVPLLKGLNKNVALKKIGLSWNGLTGKMFAKFLRLSIVKHPTLEVIDLQNNRLGNADISVIASGLKKSKSLQSLYIGGNPLNAEDYLLLLTIFSTPLTLVYLDLGNQVWLTKEAANIANTAMSKYANLKIIYKGILMNYPPEPVNMEKIIFDRCKFLTMKPKKKKLKKEFGHLMHLFLDSEKNAMSFEDFDTVVKQFKSRILIKDVALVNHLKELFVKKSGKKKESPKIYIKEMATSYLEKYPTARKPPPPPKKPRKTKNKKTKDKLKTK